MTVANPVSRRRFADVDAAVIHTGYVVPPDDFEGWQLPEGWAATHADRDERGRAVMGVNTLYVRMPSSMLMIDPSSWTAEDSLAPFAELVRGPSLGESLQALDVQPEDVTHVLISHGHPDHYNGVLQEPRSERRLRFPNATHYFPAADWPHFISDPPELPEGHSHRHAPALMLPVEQAGRVQLVDGDLEVAPGVTLLHTGGETDGHQIVRIATGRGLLFYVGDLFHVPAEYERLDTGPANRDYEALAEIRQRILTEGHLADDGSIAVATHSRFPCWGTARPAGDAWAWRYLAP
jgi:glyoxylase-like metal-dependent hydrolase (beta-lactamase superfamily II)